MAARMRLSAIAAVPLALVVAVACVQTADGAKRPCKPRSCPAPTTPIPAPTTTSTATPTPPPAPPQPVLAYYNRYPNGPRYATTDFPYGVWLQDPSKYDGDVGRQYKALGVNTYVGQWTWPGSSYAGHAQAVQNALAANGAQAFGGYSTQAVQQARTLNGDRFRGWLLEDEPDMKGTTAAQLAAKASKASSGDPSPADVRQLLQGHRGRLEQKTACGSPSGRPQGLLRQRGHRLGRLLRLHRPVDGPPRRHRPTPRASTPCGLRAATTSPCGDSSRPPARSTPSGSPPRPVRGGRVDHARGGC